LCNVRIDVADLLGRKACAENVEIGFIFRRKERSSKLADPTEVHSASMSMTLQWIIVG
jgi:hypothetical protein